MTTKHLFKTIFLQTLVNNHKNLKSYATIMVCIAYYLVSLLFCFVQNLFIWQFLSLRIWGVAFEANKLFGLIFVYNNKMCNADKLSFMCFTNLFEVIHDTFYFNYQGPAMCSLAKTLIMIFDLLDVSFFNYIFYDICIQIDAHS